MRQKTLSLLTLLILLSQTAFPALQAQETPPALQNELINLLYQPEMVATVDVRRLLTETAIDLFNNEPSSIEKLKTVMKQMEDETGIDPFMVDQAAMGLSISKNKAENAVIVIRTNAPTATMAEKIFQNQVAQGKFTMEKSPVSSRINRMKYSAFGETSEINADEVETVKNNFEELSARIKEIQTNLVKVKTVKAQEILLSELNKSASQISAALNSFLELLKTDTDLTDEKAQLDKLDKDFQNISLSDAQRAQKIAALGKQVEQFEKFSSVRLKKIKQIQSLIEIQTNFPLSVEPLNNALDLLTKLPAAEPRKTQNLRAARKLLTEFQKDLQQKLADVQNEEAGVSLSLDELAPKSIDVSKSEENVGGKRVLVIKTKQTYADQEMNSETENVLAIYSDSILLIGDQQAIRQTLNRPASQQTNNNQRMSRLIEKTPNPLAAFAIDLQNMDFGEMGEMFGGQATVWEISGGITAASKEITLSVSFDKTDIPLKINPESNKNVGSNQPVKFPVVEDNSAFADLFKLLGNTIIGAEGKITFKFEKRKFAQLIMETPKLLSGVLKNNDRANVFDKTSGK